MNSVSFEENYVNIRHESLGEGRTPEVVLDALLRAMELCADNHCFRILVDADEPLRHPTKDAIEGFVRRLAFFPGLRLAIHCPLVQKNEFIEYYVTLAQQHGTAVRYFTDREEALQWLGAR
jgi:hypothetical protein